MDSEDFSAEIVAASLGLPLNQVFKTLVARGDRRGVCLALVPASHKLDLKALALVMGDRSVGLVLLKEVRVLTGYVRGGVTALGGEKDYPVYLEESALGLSAISVSPGVRGTQILLAPEECVRATRATLAAISRVGKGPRDGARLW
jgi:Cys-tRNA(Pro)/Cys-tRNA(Cys) deacylase